MGQGEFPLVGGLGGETPSSSGDIGGATLTGENVAPESCYLAGPRTFQQPSCFGRFLAHVVDEPSAEDVVAAYSVTDLGERPAGGTTKGVTEIKGNVASADVSVSPTSPASPWWKEWVACSICGEKVLDWKVSEFNIVRESVCHPCFPAWSRLNGARDEDTISVKVATLADAGASGCTPALPRRYTLYPAP